jgi:Ribosomal proteins 50S-L15, 50S-L18e, 60S-L27A
MDLLRSTRTWAPLNLDRLQHWINQGRLISSPDNPITAHHLYKSRCVHGAHDGIKLLGDVGLKRDSWITLVPFPDSLVVGIVAVDVRRPSCRFSSIEISHPGSGEAWRFCSLQVLQRSWSQRLPQRSQSPETCRPNSQARHP